MGAGCVGPHTITSERRACRVLGQVRSTQRRERCPPDDEVKLLMQMVELATEYVRHSYR